MPATSTVPHTGDPYIDGLLIGLKWATTSLTYSFPTSASFYGSPYGSGEPGSNFKAFTAVQQAAVHATLDAYAAVANVTFTEVTETASTHADLRYAESDAPGTAWAYYPTTAAEGGDAWFNNSTHWYDNPVMGNYAWASVLHETGHALGLKHPHDTYGTFGPMPVDHDSLEYSVMSYRSYIGASTTTGYTNAPDSYPQSLMMYDIAGVQDLYGANYNTNSGATIYSWDPTTGQEFINGVAQTKPAGDKIFLTIWDGGGNDTYDFSNYSTAVSVDLGPGDWSTVSTVQLANLGNGHVAVGNIANALEYNNNPASLIENAIGGTGNDTLVGNAADNALTGGHGNDNLDGQGGTNTAVYSGANTNYSVVDNGNGTWTVTDLRGGSPDGADTLANIQFLQFSNGTVALTATPPVNHAPVAVNDGYATAAGTTLTVAKAAGVLANDSDADGNTLTAVLVGAPAHGTFNLASDGSFNFTPDAGWSGTTSFTYKANDGSADSAVATATITVAPPITANVAPAAGNDEYWVGSNKTLTVSASAGLLANDSDANGDHMTVTLVNGPSNGTVKVNADGSFTYTPSFLFAGTVSFQYRVSDGQTTSAVATATIDVVRSGSGPAIDQAIVVQNDAYAATKQTVLTIDAQHGVLANDLDKDGLAMTASLVQGSSNGTVSLNPDGSFTFTPAGTFTGATSFVYKVSDAHGVSTTATATITVSNAPPVNHAPVAVNDSYTTAAGTPLSVAKAAGVLANDTDADGNTLTAALVGAPAHGTFSLASDGSFNFAPDAGWSGTTSFTYKANDGSADSAVATATITVNPPPVNHPPVAVNDGYATTVGVPLSVAKAAGVLANDSDADGNTLTAVLVAAPAHGTFNLASDGSFSFAPDAGWSGTTSFTYKANDGSADSAAATASITVSPPVNHPPVASNDGYTTAAGTPLTVAKAAGVLANDSDADGNTLTAVLVGAPAHGTFNLASDGSFNFAPDAGWSGTTSFTYKANDGSADSAVATATIIVAPPVTANIAPMAGNDEYWVGSNKTLTVSAAAGLLANDSDANGDHLTVTLVKGTSNGTVKVNPDGSFTYTPSFLFAGTTSFQYQVSDGHTTSVVATATIDVVRSGSGPAIDQAIVVQNDAYAATKQTVLTIDAQHGVLANDLDKDGRAMTASLVQGSSNGTVSLNPNGSFTFTPTGTFTGATSFVYKVSDAHGVSTTATANITVSNTGAAPAVNLDTHPAASVGGLDGFVLANAGSDFPLHFDQLFTGTPPASSSLLDAIHNLFVDLGQHDVPGTIVEAPDNMPAPAPELIDHPLQHYSEFALL